MQIQMCVSDYVADSPNSPILFKLFIFASRKKSSCRTSDEKKNRKTKLRYFRFPPNLAPRKLIDLANYLPSSSSRRVFSFTQQFFKSGKNGDPVGKDFVAGKLVSTNFDQIQVKRIILKDSGR